MIFQMPGESYQGPPAPLDDEGRALRDRLQHHVRMLADDIGERNYWHPEGMRAAADYIDQTLREIGHEPIHHPVPTREQEFHNIEVRLPSDEVSSHVLVIGAHYDTVRGTPGADDNASGVAILLELARLLLERELEQSLRLVAFVNEEEPFFGTSAMGSLRYAREARERGQEIVGMISLEMLGYYSDEPGSQSYPSLLGYVYPDRGNFVAFVGTLRARQLVRRAIEAFREHADLPSEGLAAPEWMRDILRSDHWAFQQMGHPAIMLTDTADFRNPHYHGPGDTSERLDYESMARLTLSLSRALETMVQR